MKKYCRKHVAITQVHGSWVFLFSPLLIGLFAGGRATAASGFFVLLAVSAFMFRQPLTIAVKVWSRRRSKDDLPASFFWMGVYGLAAGLGFAGLAWLGFGYIALLGIPALPVLAWYLYLVTRREERRQFGVEIVASGVLALSAAGAFWVGQGSAHADGWWLWLLAWFQSGASIMCAVLRLEQRGWKNIPSIKDRFTAGRRAMLYATFNLVSVVLFGALGWIPRLIFIPFALQWLETLNSVLRPVPGIRPTSVGIRQLIVSSLFTILFILFWIR